MFPLAIFVLVMLLIGVGTWAAVRRQWAEKSAAYVRRGAADLADSIARSLPARAGQVLAGPLAAAFVVVVFLGVMVSVMWPFGVLMKHLQPDFDVPVFNFFNAHQIGWWSTVNNAVTQIGNRHPTELVAVLAAVVFALSRKTRQWVPLVVFPLAYVSEKYFQTSLKDLVHRQPPPTTLGSWPSGGVGRAFLIFGLVAYFAGKSLNAGLKMRVTLWTALTVAVSFEAYTRVYLLKHWISDVLPGGLLFGAALLVTWATAAWLLDRGAPVASPLPQSAPVDDAGLRFENVGVADPLGV
jgi:membrane-associated phospholipid phosphatase